MLKVLRLDFVPLIDAGSHCVPPDDFFVAGYKSTRFLTNFGIFMTVIVFVPALMLVLGLVKDALIPKSWQCNKTGTSMLNFVISVVVAVSLELCICSSLAIYGVAI